MSFAFDSYQTTVSLDYLANSKDLDRNSRVEKKKHCITSRRIPDFNFLSRCEMYNILLSGAQLKMDTPRLRETHSSEWPSALSLVSQLPQL